MKIALGHDPFGKGPQFITFRSGDDFITIRIDTRASEEEFEEMVCRINEIINSAIIVQGVCNNDGT